MQKPPDRTSPPILFTRPANEWFNRVSQKHRQMAALEPSTEEREDINRHVAAEFVYSTLRLARLNVEREKVAEFAARPTDLMGLGEDELIIVALLESLREVEAEVESFGLTAQLEPDVLIRLHNPLGGVEVFRKTAGDINRPFKPTPPDHLPAAIENACRWFAADSFAELNPVEQAAIAYLRLVELQPFERDSDTTALVAASLFTMRSGLPPIVIKPEMEQAYRAALGEGIRMNTRPMVELMAEAIERTLAEMVGIVEGKRQK